ncbi:S8 family serine peptidase [Streptomyces sp. NPDC001414]
MVSMSLGSDLPSDGTDPLSQAVNRLSAETGALFVIAAGNTGTPESIGGPGAADRALTVGAVDSLDALAPFSSQGPRVGDGGIKPEITAPGVDVLAARSRFAPEGEGDYQTLSGTSMATPHVAGVAALALSVRPGLTGEQLKNLLVGSSERTPRYDAFQAGSGRVDVPSVLHASVIATATASAGQAPAGQGESATRRAVTYTNTGGAPMTLSLSVQAPDAPAGMFRLSTERVVVPAHGTASVTLTIDASKAAGRGRWTGQVLAADPSGTVLAHTAVSLGAAAHRLTLLLKDRRGEPMSGVVEVLRNGGSFPDFYIADESGRIDAFVPEDVYSVLAFKAVQGTHGPRSLGIALLGDPEVTLDRDTTVTLDVRKVTRVDMTTPQQTEVTYQRLEYDRAFGGGNFRDYMETQTSFDSLWAQPSTHKVTHGDFWMSARWRKERPVLSVTSRSGPFTDVLRQQGITPLRAGSHRLPLVAAGNGGEADYAALQARGKAVVVRLNNVVTPAEQASAAVRAGAGLLLVVNDRPGRQLLDFRPAALTRSPIDVALVSPDEGERLLRDASARGAAVTADSRSLSPYVYDLMWMWHQQIPRRAVIKGSAKTLAKVDVTFAGPASSSRQGGEWRYDFPAYSDWGIGLPFQRPTTGHRVDWVATGSGYVWGQEAFVDGLIYEIEPRITYRPGSTAAQHWFQPVERPHLNNNYKLPTRSGSRLNLDVPAWGGSDHVGMSMDYDRMRQSLTLYQGGTRLAEGLYTTVTAEAPDEGRLPYRLVVDGSRDVAVSAYSTTTHTQWDFTSAAPPEGADAVLPLIQLDYRVATDTHGRADRRARLAVSAAHLPQAVRAGRLSPVDVELSYDDGRTWRKAARTRSGLYSIAPNGHARFVSLRANAHDSAGNTVAQTVIRAFGLR